MPGYSIEARSLTVLGWAGHNYWVLRDEHGHALAQLHGLATERRTGKAIAIGFNEARHSLRAWHYPHDAGYADSIGAPVNRTSFIRDDQPCCTVAMGDREEILARWNTAVNAVCTFNAQDLNYPSYGFSLLRGTVNSNSAYRTFGELMYMPVPHFPRRLQPGINNRLLSPEQTQALRYGTPATTLQAPRPGPRRRRRRSIMVRTSVIALVALLLAVLLGVQAFKP